jgi:hypothetical protein
MTIINDTRVVRLQRTAARTGHQHSGDERIVEQVADELVTSADVTPLPPGSLITLQRGPGSGHTEEGSVLNATSDEIGGVAGGQTTSVSFDSEDSGVTAAAIFQTEIDYALSLSAPGEYAINYKTFQIKTYTTVPTTVGSRILITYAWAPIREYLEWDPEDLDPDLEAFGAGPHQSGDGYSSANVTAGCNISVVDIGDGYKEVSLDIQSIAGEGLIVGSNPGECPQLHVDIDAYQIEYDPSENTVIFAYDVQTALDEIDGYLNVGDVVQIRKFGSESEDYPANTVFTTNGNQFELGGRRLLVYVNGIPQFAPDDYVESGTSSIQFQYSIEDSDIVDIWILPKILAIGKAGITTLQQAYDNSDIYSKTIVETDGEISIRQAMPTGSALKLISDDSITPTLIVDQSGTGEGARIKSVDSSKPSILIQKDTAARNTIIDAVTIERTSSHVSGGQTGIGSSILTQLENSGTLLFDASKIITGTSDATDSSENSYLSVELIEDGITGEKLRVTSEGKLALNTTSPTHLLHVQGDGYIAQGLDVSGDIRLLDGQLHFGPSSPNITKDGGHLVFSDHEAGTFTLSQLSETASDLVGLENTVAEHYNQHSDVIQIIRKELDGYFEGAVTTESINMVVDSSSGTSPPDGTIVTSQAEYDALGYDLKYPQDALDILPHFVNHAVKILLKSGIHLGKSGSSGWTGVLDGFLHIPPIKPSSKKKYFAPDFSAPATYFPNILFYGEGHTTIEGSQSGTSATYSITRDSGTWTTDEHKGKMVEILTGPSAGNIYVIAGNTTTELEVCGNISSTGSITFAIIENNTTCLSSLDGVSSSGFGIALGATNIIFEFRDLNFGNSSINFDTIIPSSGDYHNSATTFTRCNLLSKSYLLAGNTYAGTNSRFEISASYMRFTSATNELGLYCDTNGFMRLNGCLIDGTATSAGALIGTDNGGRYNIANTVFRPDAGFSGSCISLASGSASFSTKLRLYGNSTCTGVFLRDEMGACSIRNIGGVVRDCAIGVHVESVGAININSSFSSGECTGNTIGWKIENGSSISALNPQIIEATTDIEIDGDNTSYSILDSGDKIVGAKSSSIIRK